MKSLFLFVLLLSVQFFAIQVDAKIEIVDDAGNLISLDYPAKRIISLSPGLTELVYSAGGADKIIATVSYSDFPKQAKLLPRVGSFDAMDMEQILSLNPDIIFAWQSGNPKNQINQLKKLGFKVYISEPVDFDSIEKTILNIGRLIGSTEIAEKNAKNFAEQLQKLRRQYPSFEQKDQIPTFIQIWNDPVMSVNSAHLITKVVSFCGGRNIFADAISLTYSPDIESVITRNPQIIIATGMKKDSNQWLKRWKKWPSLSAVKHNRLYGVNPDHLVRHTPRILLGIEEVCKLIRQDIQIQK